MKIGGFSVILTLDEVSNRVVPDEHVLYKVTQCKKTHNGEDTYIDFLKTQNDYVAKIYKDTIVNINDDDKLLEYIKDNIKKYDNDNINNIFYNNIKSDYKLIGYFIENGGSIDLFDTLTHLINLEDNIWMADTENKVYSFSIHMCECLKYLQDNKMGHFDIKPENIIYNDSGTVSFGKRFKLIDFGFADRFPFEKNSTKMCGTPLYIPCMLPNTNYPEWSLKIKTNDWNYNPVQKKYYHYINYTYEPELIYKTDVFSMGIVFNQLLHYINDYLYRLHSRQNQFTTIRNLIKHMTHKDIVSRYYSVDCINFLEADVEPISENCLCLKRCFKN